MKKPVRITQEKLRSLIKEAIQHRPAGTPEPIDERFGPWDARGPEGIDSPSPWNFENTYKEIFRQALQPVMEEFQKAIQDGYENGMGPLGAGGESELRVIADNLLEDVLDMIAQTADKALDRLL